ncbi:MAG: hypothetical protein JNL11_03600 [Bdellovibrionaceae bacterium]|nr:hypothetical protein [Pseudobdellovibrionaceae bacterium]
MKLIIILVALNLPTLVHAQIPNDPSFFANAQIQSTVPEAFAVQEKSIPFLKLQRARFQSDVLRLVNSIRTDKNLILAITRFPNLSLEQKAEVMRQTFTHVTKSLGIMPPLLVLDNNFKNATYFDFDLKNPSPGRVILSPKELAAMPNPYSPLLYLIHETKHSAQFQLAFSKQTGSSSILAKSYRAAFTAQKDLQGKLSFSDFLTLVSEYDAFQYGNAVVALLKGEKASDERMGTYASQFDQHGRLKIDLIQLFETHGAANFLSAFNLLEVPQWKIIRNPNGNNRRF